MNDLDRPSDKNQPIEHGKKYWNLIELWNNLKKLKAY